MQPADPSPPPPSVLPYPSPSSVPSGAPVSGTPLLAEDEVEDEPVAFWERKRTGQATGTGLVAASVCGLIFMFASRVWLLPWSSRLNDGGPPFWFGLAAGAASLALGFYLVHYKHYLRDPQARKQYRSEFRRQPFVVSLRNFGWDGLVQFLRAEELRAAFLFEVQHRPFHELWQTYGAQNLERALDLRVVLQEELAACFYALPDSGLQGSALVRAAAEAGRWAARRLAVDRASFATRLAEAPGVRELSFEALLDAGAQQLFEAGLLPKNELRAALLRCLQPAPGLALRRLVGEHRWALAALQRAGAFEVALLAPAIAQELEAHRDDVCAFLDRYWEWPLCDHLPLLVHGPAAGELALLGDELDQARRRNEERVRSADDKAEQARKQAAKHLDTQCSSAESQLTALRALPHLTAAELRAKEALEAQVLAARNQNRAELNAIASQRERRLAKAARELQEARTRINRQWLLCESRRSAAVVAPANGPAAPAPSPPPYNPEFTSQGYGTPFAVPSAPPLKPGLFISDE